MSYIWVAIGGALGSVARYWCAGLMARVAGVTFPWGTLLVNVLGSAVIGVLAGLVAVDGKPLIASDMRAFLMVGVLGGYTTFSSFSLDTLNLARAGAWGAATANVVSSVVLCLAAVAIGYYVSATLQR
jgi:CrcB protein